jgi:hypothetical protein
MSQAPRGLIGVIHLLAMPGDPGYREGGFAAVERHALRDAEALVAGGVDALIVENFGSAPFPKGDAGHRLPPHQVAFLALVTRQLVGLGRPVGVNCLRNDALAALGVAAAAGASFVRVNVHTGAYVTDQGLIEGEADVSMRYRMALGATGIAVLADVLVKHATPLAPLTATSATHDCLDRGLADGVIVTGAATGAPVDLELLREVRAAAGGQPVYTGSGLDPARAEALVPLLEGAIVGTWVKQGGQLRAPVDEGRVRELVGACRGRFRG